MLYIVGIIRKFRGDFFERITHLMSDLVKAPVLRLVLCFWVSGKKKCKKGQRQA